MTDALGLFKAPSATASVFFLSSSVLSTVADDTRASSSCSPAELASRLCFGSTTGFSDLSELVLVSLLGEAKLTF